jgi:protease I
MVIARENFRDEELLEPKKVFEQAGARVVIASSTLKKARGMLGEEVTPDVLLKDVAVSDYDAVVFVGGSGAREYFEDETAHTIARSAVRQGKITGAICIAPFILANAGVLKGKKATIWSSMGSDLDRKGCIYTKEDVQVDGRIVTADGPGSAGMFARTIVKLLTADRRARSEKPDMIPATPQSGMN